jgi:hypothetical protein
MAKRKKTDTVQFNVRLREELRKRLEVSARAEKRSLNSEIVARLAQSFDQSGGQDQLTRLTEMVSVLLKLARGWSALYFGKRSQLEDLSLEPSYLAPRVGDVDPGPHLPAGKADDPDAGGVIDLMDALRGMLGRAPTGEELSAPMRRVAGGPSDEEPELPMPQRQAKGGKS